MVPPSNASPTRTTSIRTLLWSSCSGASWVPSNWNRVLPSRSRTEVQPGVEAMERAEIAVTARHFTPDCWILEGRFYSSAWPISVPRR